MNILIKAAIVLGTCVVMEMFAWAVHKYIMHGLAWSWHKSHHEHHDHKLEKNDLFALIFAQAAIAIILLAQPGYEWLYWVGAGMTLYGFLYFIIHDGLTHGRWPFRWIPRRGYLKRLVQAHRLHHAVDGPENGVSFGFLYAPPARKLSRVVRERRRSAAMTGKETRA